MPITVLHTKFVTLPCGCPLPPSPRGLQDHRAPQARRRLADCFPVATIAGLKLSASLCVAGCPTESGTVGVEGVRLTEEALRSGCRIEAVLFSESGERHRERLAPYIARAEIAFPVLRTTDRLFEGLADTEHPQGVAALVAAARFFV